MHTAASARLCQRGCGTLQLGQASLYVGISINGGTPIAGWFITENPIKMDDLGIAPLPETRMWKQIKNTPPHREIVVKSHDWIVPVANGATWFFCHLESRLVVSCFTISIADSPSLVCMTNPNDGCVFLSGADWLVTSGAGCCSRWWVISWYPHDIPSWLVIPMDSWLISVISHGLTKEQSLQLNAVVSSSSMGALVKLWWSFDSCFDETRFSWPGRRWFRMVNQHLQKGHVEICFMLLGILSQSGENRSMEMADPFPRFR